MNNTKRIRVAVQILLCTLLLIGAAVLYAHIPNRVESYAPITVRGTAPATVTGHNIAVTVHRVLSAPRVHIMDVDVADPPAEANLITKGRWIVVDASYETPLSTTPIQLQLSAGSRLIDRQYPGTLSPGQPHFGLRTAVVFDAPLSSDPLKVLAIDDNYRFSDDLKGQVRSQLNIEIPADMVEQRSSIEVRNGQVAP